MGCVGPQRAGTWEGGLLVCCASASPAGLPGIARGFCTLPACLVHPSDFEAILCRDATHASVAVASRLTPTVADGNRRRRLVAPAVAASIPDGFVAIASAACLRRQPVVNCSHGKSAAGAGPQPRNSSLQPWQPVLKPLSAAAVFLIGFPACSKAALPGFGTRGAKLCGWSASVLRIVARRSVTVAGAFGSPARHSAISADGPKAAMTCSARPPAPRPACRAPPPRCGEGRPFSGAPGASACTRARRAGRAAPAAATRQPRAPRPGAPRRVGVQGSVT